MSEATIDDLRAHVLGQLDAQLARGGAKRIASAILVLLDENGLLDVPALMEVAYEQLDFAIDHEMTTKGASLLAGLCFMAGEQSDEAAEAFERFLGEDLSLERREEVASAASALDGVLQHLGHLRRHLLAEAPGDRSFLTLVAQLDGSADEMRIAAQEAIRRGVDVRSASRIVSFLASAPPRFEAGEALVDEIILAAVEEWTQGQFQRSKERFDRVLARDVLHDERDMVVRLIGVMGSRVLTPLAWSREARRELLLVVIGRITSTAVAEVRHVLSLVHRCDPVGVAARDPAEALRIHCSWNGVRPEVLELADRALEEIDEAADYPSLALRFGRTVDELKSARAQLRRYQKSPIERLVLGVDETSCDMIFAREGPEFVIAPGMRGEVPAVPTEEVLAVAHVILDASGEFMRYGLEKLTPLDLVVIARQTDLTIDQLKRVTEGVRVGTPWGTMALTHFMRM